jgi:hypothetical protein
MARGRPPRRGSGDSFFLGVALLLGGGLLALTCGLLEPTPRCRQVHYVNPATGRVLGTPMTTNRPLSLAFAG